MELTFELRRGIPVTLVLRAAVAAAPFLPCAALGAQTPRAGEPVPVDPTDPHLVVRLLPGASAEPIAAALGGTVLRSRPELGLHLIDLPGTSEAAVETAAWAIKGLPTVLYSEVDQPADPPESVGCGLPEAIGAMQCTIAFIDSAPSPGTYSGQSATGQIHCPQAHALATGVPLLVGVVDTGVELTHPLFAGRIVGGWDYLLGVSGGADAANQQDDDGDGIVDEGAGHGSHVAGLIALADPAAQILPLRVLDSDGNGTAFLVACAIYDAVDAGATVINLSLSTREGCDVFAEALMYAECHGVDVVTSSGNSGDETQFPGHYDPADYVHLTPPWLPSGTVLTGANLLVVSAVDGNNQKPPFACYGPTVDLATPGVDVYSAQLNASYAWWSGTSMSSGLASGSLSFLYSIWSQGGYPGTPIELLRETALDIDGVNPSYAGGLGSGLLDLGAAAGTLLGE